MNLSYRENKMVKTIKNPNEHLAKAIEEKIFLIKFSPDTESHITVNQDICILCKGKECTKFCPANVFALSTINDKLIVGYENCIECGLCTIGCPYGSIQYNHPKNGSGRI